MAHRLLHDRSARPSVARLPNPVPRNAPSPNSERPNTMRLAQVIAEVLAGARPAAQLGTVAAPDVVSMLARNSGRLGARREGPPHRPIVDSVHVHEPSDGVAEACAVVRVGSRYRAIALRLEVADGRWQCTALHVG
jgi:hypothetical protein